MNDFFEVVALDRCDGEVQCRVKFNPSHYIYQAHFPGNPVTPGVCLVQIAGEILESALNKTLLLSMIKNIKFKKIIVPADTPLFSFSNVLEEDGGLSADVKIADDGSEYVKMSLSFSVQDHG